MRFPFLDGFRGFFLVMMTVHHLQVELFFPLQLIDYTRFSTFGAAQGFVFLSGVVVAMVYGRKLVKGSEEAMRRALWQRIWLIYRYHAGLVGLVILFSVLIVQAGNQSPLAAFNTGTPVLNAALSLLLLSGPTFIDILPMYLVFLAFTPAALIAMHKGHYAQVLTVSVGLWLFAQPVRPVRHHDRLEPVHALGSEAPSQLQGAVERQPVDARPAVERERDELVHGSVVVSMVTV